MDDDQFYKNLAKEFLMDIRTRIRAVLANPAHLNFDELKMIGHKLKGTAPSLGLLRLAEQGKQLEREITDHLKAESLRTTSSIAASIEEYLERHD